LKNGGKELELYNGDIQDWRITFVDTGTHSNIGERLRAVEKYLGEEEQFLANYSDGLTDLDLTKYLDYANRQDKIATFVSVKPNLSYHVVETGSDGLVGSIKELSSTGVRINGGFFVLKREIFKYLHPGEELVMEPFRRLVNLRQLAAYEYDGFFAAMDTFKDRQHLEDLYESGEPPWQIWKPRAPERSYVLVGRAGKSKNGQVLATERLT
jgi:glucose-1-phosphate cytidylyltransferase